MPRMYDPTLNDGVGGYFNEPPGTIDLAVANPRGDKIRIALTVDGKGVLYQMPRKVAATLIAELARAIAAGPADG